jgi:hypothetical protein
MGATSFALSDNVFVYGNDEEERDQQSWTYEPVPGGALLTFHLRDPSRQAGFVGDLTFNWTGRASPVVSSQGYDSSRLASGAQPPLSFIADEDGDMALRKKVQRLGFTDQQVLYREVKNLTHPPRCAVKEETLATLPPGERVKPNGRFPDYSHSLRSVPDPARLARKAKAHEFVL